MRIFSGVGPAVAGRDDKQGGRHAAPQANRRAGSRDAVGSRPPLRRRRWGRRVIGSETRVSTRTRADPLREDLLGGLARLRCPRRSLGGIKRDGERNRLVLMPSARAVARGVSLAERTYDLVANLEPKVTLPGSLAWRSWDGRSGCSRYEAAAPPTIARSPRR